MENQHIGNNKSVEVVDYLQKFIVETFYANEKGLRKLGKID